MTGTLIRKLRVLIRKRVLRDTGKEIGTNAAICQGMPGHTEWKRGMEPSLQASGGGWPR